ncbi:sulfite exporter TauE/SafE family protein [Paenactinomyces guangxiensis]|uniref:Probable membrane transporter protein n=1 Tax=Paenactinomyces guangxiensis TaxID=1490290 RepID=A0A7W1WPZ8_9BACL|nr:sulfite exporter TauE/SafE family protein [Paenactinomyces guangxiensis]MBA4493932.1 sulfite exporter TauE/SafE family protein [Paenactinomyces guangxiensis]MBH8591399.1 sulfite exporter TauE/SafE family protein [Paenactinomyces guangxiensis]
MQKLIILGLIGFAAQLVDGSLGMAYGVTSSSLLLMFGIAPAVASASVHMAEVVTTAASGISHLRFGNVDKTIVRSLIIPGSVGAFAGACFLSSLPGDLVKPYVSAFLFLLGFYILGRFLFGNPSLPGKSKITRRFLIPLGLIAGFADSTGGGGWGPLTTPILLSRKGIETRKVIGSVDTSECAIAISATAGFFVSLGWTNINWPWVATLMIGGVVAAPIAAWLVKIIPSHVLGVMVGGLIILTNVKTLLDSFKVISPFWHGLLYIVLSLIWAVGIAMAVYKHKNKLKKKMTVPLPK